MKYLSKIMRVSVPNSGLRGYIGYLSFGLFVLLSAACSDSQEAVMGDYSQRIERLSNASSPKLVHITPPSQPQVSALRQPLADIRLSLIDSLRLTDCRLSQIVAERNSSLGKVMTPANQLYYEVQVTRALRECLAKESALSPDLRETLSESLHLKEENIKQAVHNFLTTDDVWRRQFRMGSIGLPFDDQDAFTNTYIALNYFAHTLGLLAESPHHDALDLSAWHSHVETLHRSRFLPAYWRTLAFMPSQLDRITDQLTQATGQLGCSPVARPQRAQYMHNVMMKVYIEQLQPALARWYHYGQQLDPVLLQLMSHTQGVLWHTYGLSLGLGDAARVQESTYRHTQQWQKLLQRCRLSPQGEPINGAL